MESWQSFEQEAAKSIRTNSIIFLRRAAEEITRHDDGDDAAFDHETGTVVTVLTQMALELAIAAYLVEHQGIRAILEGAEALTEEQIRENWLNNRLRTKKFEQNKQLLARVSPGVWKVFEGVVDMFQNSRNKIVHVHFRFDRNDLYDLKFESTFVLIKVVTYFIFGSDYDHANNFASLLSRDTFDKLVRFKAYQSHVRAMAEEWSSPALCCPWCRQRAFAGAELKCFSCGYEHPHMHLLDCLACAQYSVIYDNLNLELNATMPTLCLHCGDKQEVAECQRCTEAYLVRPGRPPYCSQACFEDEQANPGVRRPRRRRSAAGGAGR